MNELEHINFLTQFEEAEPAIGLELPEILMHVFTTKSRYKVLYGGRGGAKSQSIATMLIVTAYEKKIRVLCTREVQNSIKDSVHKLLVDSIDKLGLSQSFHVTDSSIKCENGSVFIFKGLKFSANEIKSTEGIDICWVEEAQNVSRESWEILKPTIRKKDSEIWISFNPKFDHDPVYQDFVLDPPPNAISQEINWRDNPWFPEVLMDELEHLKKVNYNLYLHVWEGKTIKNSDSQVFKDKWEVQECIPRKDHLLYYGADWGFSNDPTVLIRCWIDDGNLYVDYAEYGYKTELNNIKEVFNKVPLAKSRVIIGDSSRPETISYMNKKEGYRVRSSKKWKNCIKDGVEFIRSFNKIIVHPRCELFIEELTLYSHKIHRVTGEILPDLVDDYNHGIDALRYALQSRICLKDKIDIKRLTSI